jgi:hypothetical protein
MPSIDLLTDKKGVSQFIEYCKSHFLVNEIIILPKFYRTKIQISFIDGSQLNFKLVRKMIKKGLDCIPITDILKHATVNNFGMLIPACHHHFEYLLIKYQFAESAFPDKFQKYFSSLDVNNRTAIFRYIQPKYNLVFNVIEDLYIHKGGVLLKIMVGLRHKKNNSLLKMAFRISQLTLWKISHIFLSSMVVIPSKNLPGPKSGSALGRKAATS